jgi:predicted DNA-binding transcriptional regulator AlpA
VSKPVPAVVVLKPEDILTIEQLSARLQVSRAWIFSKTRSRCRHPLPAMRVGRFLRFSWPSVCVYLTSCESTEQPDRRRAA